MYDFDIVILGGGPAGYVAAIRGGQLGASVALIERENLGGTCLNRGCIPAKTLYASSRLLASVRNAGAMGIKMGDVSFSLGEAVSRKDKVVGGLVGGLRQLLKSSGVTVFKGDGYIERSDRVIVEAAEGRTVLTPRKIIVATGSEPKLVPCFNIDGRSILTSTDILSLNTLPESLMVIGGGVSGCEFASMFSEFGTRVFILEMFSSILPSEDRDISLFVTKKFKERDISIHTGVSVSGMEKVGGGVKTQLEDGRAFLTEKALVSVGRRFNSTGFGLEEVGVFIEDGRIVVDDKMATNIEGIYAAGDVTGGLLLAHVASMEGRVAVNNALGLEMKADYSAIPSAIYTDPEVASVGIRIPHSSDLGCDVRVGRFPYAANGKALCMNESSGFIKVIADKDSGRILGCSIAGSCATDIIGEATLAIKNGLEMKDLINTVHAHPTLPEMITEAVEDIDGMAIHKAGRRI